MVPGAVKFESGNVSWHLKGKQLSGPLNGLHFPSTRSAAGSNHDGIKITCGRIVSSKQQLRDPSHSSWNESLKMHLSHEDGLSFSALIDYELFSWWMGLAALLVPYWLTCSWFFFVIGKNSCGIIFKKCIEPGNSKRKALHLTAGKTRILFLYVYDVIMFTV